MVGSRSTGEADALGVSSSSSGMLLPSSCMLPPLCMLVSSLPKSKLDIRIGNVVVGNASSAGFLIARCLDGLPAGLAGLCMPKAKVELKLGLPGMDFARPIEGAERAAECDCVLKCPLLNGLPVRGGKANEVREVSQGKT